jgi:hypothetical protein
MSSRKSNYIKRTPVINELTGKRLYIKKKKLENKYIQITEDEEVDLLRYRIVDINDYKYKILREKDITPLYLMTKIKKSYKNIKDINILTEIFNEINKIINGYNTDNIDKTSELIDKNNIINYIDNNLELIRSKINNVNKKNRNDHDDEIKEENNNVTK